MQKKDRGIQLQEYRGKKKERIQKKKDMLWSLPACPDLFVIKPNVSEHETKVRPRTRYASTKTSGKTCKYSCPTGTFRPYVANKNIQLVGFGLIC